MKSARFPSQSAPLSEAERRASLDETLRGRAAGDIWLFAYGSLVWNPQVEYEERLIATLHGYHRRLCLWSRSNRGTPERPGLVLGLDRGGSCRGLGLRLAAHRADSELEALWAREMVYGAYRPTWVSCLVGERVLTALTFVVRRDSSGYTGALSDRVLLQAIAQGHGRYGSCRDYVFDTVAALLAHGIADRELLRVRRLLSQSSFP